MADGGGIGGCKLAPRLLEQIMTGLWSFVSLNQVFAASIDLAHAMLARAMTMKNSGDLFTLTARGTYHHEARPDKGDLRQIEPKKVTTQVTTCTTLFLLPRPLGEGWGEGQRTTTYYRSMHRPLALTPALSQGERE